MMKTQYKKLAVILGMIGTAALFTACEVEQTQEGELPDVDVDVKGGQVPKYDVDAPEVDVDVDKKKVEVPVPDVDVDVKMPDETDEAEEVNPDGDSPADQ